MTALILASQSPRRRDLLQALGITFEVQASDAEELDGADLDPQELVLHNAQLKASDVANRFSNQWVLGSDTAVALEGKVYGKPETMAAAETMLQSLQGKEHAVYTGVCLVHQATSRQELWCEGTKVGFRPLSLTQIRDYLSRINPLDKAGAYGIQEGGERIVSRVEGSLSNVVGLPLESLELVLERIGIR
ncbi:Maf family protein [bacterium]|jgi:septum formation protein|nr:septum formation protein Maf [Verrucomicrobiota bacterium]MDA7497125.1 Maf family protein [bacterium]MDA7511031.1 Maf family protein [Verrucomicrobiota bacterium]MDA7632874.1 Maf family protein [bacterium]MDA7657222.1 Maf family protein [Verrucomicrobiota bacterium]